MEIKKKIYRNMSIISFTIALVLILNTIMPIITKAEETKSNSGKINIEFVVDKENNTIEAKGNIPEEYNGYELYWANKNYTREKPTNVEDNYQYLMDTIEWFEKSENKLAGKEVTTVEGNTKISSKASYEEGNSYAVLCVAHGPQNEIMMSFVNYIPGKKEEKTSEPIKIELSNEDKKIIIHASDETAKITIIKYIKSNTAMKVEDFKDEGNVVKAFEQSNNVTTSINVDEYGIYYIYAENEQGSKCVEPIVLKEQEQAKKDDISVDLYRITDEKYGDIAIRAVSKTGKITGIKYYLSDTPIDVEKEDVRNKVKQEATAMTVYGKPKEEIVKSDTKIKDEKYIAIFVESTDDVYTYEYWSAPGTIGNLNKVDIAPWENSNENEEAIEDEQKQEETKQEETKQEETKQEETKQEETKQEETKQEETKQEETKQEETKQEETKHEETKQEETKQENPKQEDKKEIEGPKVETNVNNKVEEAILKIEQQLNEKNVELTKKNEEANKKNEEANKKNEEANKKNEEPKNKKEESNKQNEESNNKNIVKNNKEKVDTIVSDNSANKNIPQTGKNDNFAIYGIILFTISGVFSLIKYKKTRE